MAHQPNEGLTRRRLLRRLGVWGATLAALAPSRGADMARAAVCAPTPAQARGPYYPVQPIPARTDLVSGEPAGEVVVLHGVVQDTSCRPLPDVRVEIWQADGRGHYHHPADATGEALDPAFRYFGRTETDGDGRYRFRTVHPAAYPPGARYQRPPHIHFRVVPPRGAALTTQLYFPGEGQRAYDALYRAIPAQQRTAVEVRLAPPPAGESARRASFDIVLETT